MNTNMNGPAIICQAEVLSNGLNRKCGNRIQVSIQDFIADKIICPKCKCVYNRHPDQDTKVVDMVKHLNDVIANAKS